MKRGSDSCAKVDALLLDYAYGELESDDRVGVEVHLAECEECRLAFEAMAGTRRLMQRLEPEPAPEAGLESLLDYAKKAAARQADQPRAHARWRWLVPAFSAGGVALALLFVLSKTQEPRELLVPQAAPEHVAQAGAAHLARQEKDEFEQVLEDQREVLRAQPLVEFAAQPDALVGRAAAERAPPAKAKTISKGSEGFSAAPRPQAVRRQPDESKRAEQPQGKSEQSSVADSLVGGGALFAGDAPGAVADAAPSAGRAVARRERLAERAPKQDAAADSDAEPQAQLAARPAAPAPPPATAAVEVDDMLEEAVEKKVALNEAERAGPAEDRESAPGSAFDTGMQAAAAASARGDHRGSATILERLLANVPTDDARAPPALLMLGREFELAGEIAAAEKAYLRFLALYPSHPSATVAEAGRARSQATTGAAGAASNAKAGSRGAGWPNAAPAAVHRSKAVPATSFDEAQAPAEQR